MNTPGWVKDATFYQIFPDRFARSKRMPDLDFEPWHSPPTKYGFKGGDLFGIVEKLDYLTDLGISALYLNPIFASASNHRYHTYDYYNVDPLLGGNDALRTLIDESRERQNRIILDGVFNHASRGFWQFHHVLENGINSPYIDWFHFDPERLNGTRRWGAYPSQEEEQAIKNEGSLKVIGYLGWWDLPALPKFNTDNPAVREFLFRVAEHWMKAGIDGWRLDVASEIDDDSFWQELRNRVRFINPEAYMVGEIWHEAERWLQGDQFDAVMNYLFTSAVMSFCGGKHVDINMVNQVGGLKDRVQSEMDAPKFADEIDRLTNLYHPDITYSQLNLLDSHDMPRFLTCVNDDLPSLKLAMLFMFTFLGAPCLFYGDEIGITGAHDPACRKGFPWDESAWNMELLSYTKELIALRRDNPVLRHGSYKRLFSEGHAFAFAREFEDICMITLFNVGDKSNTITFPFDNIIFKNHPTIIFGSDTKFWMDNNHLNIELPARVGLVLRV